MPALVLTPARLLHFSFLHGGAVCVGLGLPWESVLSVPPGVFSSAAAFTPARSTLRPRSVLPNHLNRFDTASGSVPFFLRSCLNLHSRPFLQSPCSQNTQSSSLRSLVLSFLSVDRPRAPCRADSRWMWVFPPPTAVALMRSRRPSRFFTRPFIDSISFWLGGAAFPSLALFIVSSARFTSLAMFSASSVSFFLLDPKSTVNTLWASIGASKTAAVPATKPSW